MTGTFDKKTAQNKLTFFQKLFSQFFPILTYEMISNFVKMNQTLSNPAADHLNRVCSCSRFGDYYAGAVIEGGTRGENIVHGGQGGNQRTVPT